MRKLLLALILIMAFSLHAQAGVTLWAMKGELWNNFDEVGKIMYTQGVFDGLAFSDFKVFGVDILTDISLEQYVHAIDEFYSDYRNSLIPVPFVLKIINLEVSGMSKDSVEVEIINYRKQFSKSK